MPKKRPEYRQNRSHLDFLLPIKQKNISVKTFQHVLFQELKQHYQLHALVNQQDASPSAYTIEKLIQEVHKLNPDFKPRTYEEDVSQVVANMNDPSTLQ